MELMLEDKKHPNRKHYIQDYIGKTFGRLEVLGRVKLNKIANPLWLCTCTCGRTTTVEVGSLLCGKVKSCGCLTIDSATTHGCSDHQMYNVWVHMIHRCNDPANKHYFQQGIRVCNAWLDVKVFLAWCDNEGYDNGLELDRKDNSLGYSPSNCRLTTREGNNQNRRKFNCNPSGYTGVRSVCNGWLSEVNNIRLGTFDTKKRALEVRNNFIVTNGLFNPVQKYIPQ